MSALRRVVVTGVGLVTPLGITTRAVWRALTEVPQGDEDGKSSNTSGIKRHAVPQFVDTYAAHGFAAGQDASTSSLMSQALGGESANVTAAMVPRGTEHNAQFPGPEGQLASAGVDPRRHALFTAYALLAAAEAARNAHLDGRLGEPDSRLGCSIGSGMGSVADIAAYGASMAVLGAASNRRVSPHFVPRVLANAAASAVSVRYGAAGPLAASATACAAGSAAISEAAMWIRLGLADAAFAGGADACADAVAISGFQRMRALAGGADDSDDGGDKSAAETCRPFHADRSGFVLGEGAAVLVLESLEHALERGAPIYCELAGIGMSADAHHAAAPDPEGRGVANAVRACLKDAKLAPRDVGYINAHATSTPAGDIAEMRGLATAMAPDAAHNSCYVGATKAATGHLLGAAGTVEAALAALAVHHGVVPSTLHTDVVDPRISEIASEGGLEIVHAGAHGSHGVAWPSGADGRSRLRVALSNASGFGGSNVCLLFQEHDTR